MVIFYYLMFIVSCICKRANPDLFFLSIANIIEKLWDSDQMVGVEGKHADH